MIRPLRPADIDQFISLRLKSVREEVFSFGSDPDVSVDRTKSIADLENKNAENFILGKFISEQLVGITGVIRHQNKKCNHKAWIWGMYVLPEFRGQGISKALLNKAIYNLQQLEGLQRIELSVTSKSPAAHRLYSSVGFQEYGRQKNAMLWEGVYVDEIYMDLALD